MATRTATTTHTTRESDPREYRRSRYHEADVVVVGAGIFGCAIAHALGQQGRSVLLLERWMKEPDRIVGELLQPGGIASLKKLGLGHCLEGMDGTPCHGYSVTFHGDTVKIPFPEVDADGNVTLNTDKGPRGIGFHHGRFITNLRRACLAHENITVVETDVTSVIRGETSDQVLGVQSMTTNADTGKKVPDYYFGQLTIIADGYASKFRKDLLPITPVVKSKFYALELIDAPLINPGFGHVVIGDYYPILMYQIGTHETRVLIDVPSDIPEAAPAAGGVRGYIRNCVIPTVPEQLRPCFERAIQDGKIPRSMPNSYLPPSHQRNVAGLLLLGDAMNMRHPLTGGGMTVAFNDVLIISDLLHPDRVPDLSNGPAVRKALKTFHWRRKSLTAILNVLAMALYALFAADNRQLRALRAGCFEYFRRGRATIPVTLMAGLIKQPALLAQHFFTVAFLAIYMHACDVMSGPVGILKAPLALVDSILILWRASILFLPILWRELI